MARVEQSIEINVPVHTAYDQLTQFEQYPRFVQNVEQVRQVDDTHLHLRTKTGNLDLEWEAEITQQVPDKCIAWRNTNGPKYEGRIELQPTREDATRITVTMECDPKQQVLAQHGNAETAIAQQAETDLARFKKFIERLGQNPKDIQPRPSNADGGAASGGGQVPGEAVGKAIGQTASERWEADGGSIRQAPPSGTAQQRVEQGAAPRPGPQAPPPPQLQWMSGIFHLWDEPLGMMRRLSEDMEHFLERFAGRAVPGTQPRAMLHSLQNGAWMPPLEIAQRNNEFVVCAELAGVRREDVQVEVRNDRLTIEGDRRQEPPHEPREVRSTERAYGHFYREIALPPGADPAAANATMRDGLLEITVPLHSGALKGRRIEIRAPQ